MESDAYRDMEYCTQTHGGEWRVVVVAVGGFVWTCMTICKSQFVPIAATEATIRRE